MIGVVSVVAAWFLSLALVSATWSMTLPTEGLSSGTEPSYLCDNLKFVNAGGFATTSFWIRFTARCALLPGNKMQEWDTLNYTNVTIDGSYDSTAHTATEGVQTAKTPPTLLLKNVSQCSKNPWLVGYSVDICQSVSVTNNTQAKVDGPLPLSPSRMGTVLSCLQLQEYQAQEAKNPTPPANDLGFVTTPPGILLPKPDQAFLTDVKIRLVPVPGSQSPIYPLEFQWWQGQPSGWVTKSVIPSLNTKMQPNGTVIPKAKFGANGKWRVRARNPFFGSSGNCVGN